MSPTVRAGWVFGCSLGCLASAVAIEHYLIEDDDRYTGWIIVYLAGLAAAVVLAVGALALVST